MQEEALNDQSNQAKSALDNVKLYKDSNLLLILSAQRTNQQCLGAPMKRGSPLQWGTPKNKS